MSLAVLCGVVAACCAAAVRREAAALDDPAHGRDGQPALRDLQCGPRAAFLVSAARAPARARLLQRRHHLPDVLRREISRRVSSPARKRSSGDLPRRSWLSWQSSSIAGILLASLIPDNWGLELAGTLALIPLIVSAIATRSTLAAVGIAEHRRRCSRSTCRTGWALPLAVFAALAAGTFADVIIDRMAPRKASPAKRALPAQPACRSARSARSARSVRHRPARHHAERRMTTTQVWLAILGMGLRHRGHARALSGRR